MKLQSNMMIQLVKEKIWYREDEIFRLDTHNECGPERRQACRGSVTIYNVTNIPPTTGDPEVTESCGGRIGGFHPSARGPLWKAGR